MSQIKFELAKCQSDAFPVSKKSTTFECESVHPTRRSETTITAEAEEDDESRSDLPKDDISLFGSVAVIGHRGPSPTLDPETDWTQKVSGYHPEVRHTKSYVPINTFEDLSKPCPRCRFCLTCDDNALFYTLVFSQLNVISLRVGITSCRGVGTSTLGTNVSQMSGHRSLTLKGDAENGPAVSSVQEVHMSMSLLFARLDLTLPPLVAIQLCMISIGLLLASVRETMCLCVCVWVYVCGCGWRV